MRTYTLLILPTLPILCTLPVVPTLPAIPTLIFNNPYTAADAPYNSDVITMR